MNAKCKCCGLHWNVSIKQYIPASGYVCPLCRQKPILQNVSRRTGYFGTKALKYIFSILAILGFIGLLLSASASDAGANLGQAAATGCLSIFVMGVGTVGFNHYQKLNFLEQSFKSLLEVKGRRVVL